MFTGKYNFDDRKMNAVKNAIELLSLEREQFNVSARMMVPCEYKYSCLSGSAPMYFCTCNEYYEEEINGEYVDIGGCLTKGSMIERAFEENIKDGLIAADHELISVPCFTEHYGKASDDTFAFIVGKYDEKQYCFNTGRMIHFDKKIAVPDVDYSELEVCGFTAIPFCSDGYRFMLVYKRLHFGCQASSTAKWLAEMAHVVAWAEKLDKNRL